mmetsp:Transcript_16607/g.33110  ORF Transcript_16607/g.33110 Transcript_16607/m.33110 type:complete len:243 (-) Transcript_16607:173-901(-)
MSKSLLKSQNRGPGTARQLQPCNVQKAENSRLARRVPLVTVNDVPHALVNNLTVRVPMHRRHRNGPVHDVARGLDLSRPRLERPRVHGRPLLEEKAAVRIPRVDGVPERVRLHLAKGGQEVEARLRLPQILPSQRPDDAAPEDVVGREGGLIGRAASGHVRAGLGEDVEAGLAVELEVVEEVGAFRVRLRRVERGGALGINATFAGLPRLWWKWCVEGADASGEIEARSTEDADDEDDELAV